MLDDFELFDTEDMIEFINDQNVLEQRFEEGIDVLMETEK